MLTSHGLPLSAAEGVLQQLVPADDGAASGSPSTPPNPLCSPDQHQQLSQQLQVIVDCLFQGLQSEGAAEQLQQVVGPELLDQVEVAHEQEVGGMQEQAAADKGNEQQGHQMLGGDGVASVGGTSAGGGGLVPASTAASPTKRMRITLPAQTTPVLGMMGPLQAAAAAATGADTPATAAVPAPLYAAIAGPAEPSVQAQAAAPVVKQRQMKATLRAKGAEVMGDNTKQEVRGMQEQEQQGMGGLAKKATADRGDEQQGWQTIGTDGMTSVGGTSAGGGGLVAASTAAGPTKRMRMTLPAQTTPVVGTLGPLQAAAAVTDADTPANVAVDAPLDPAIAGPAEPSVEAQTAAPVVNRRPVNATLHAKGAEIMGDSSKQPKRVRSPILWPTAAEVAADAGGDGGGDGTGTGSGRQRTGHVQIQLPKNWDASGNRGTAVGGMLDMDLDTLAKVNKGAKGRNPAMKQPAQHQRDGSGGRVPPARMALEGMGGSGFGGHAREPVAGQK